MADQDQWHFCKNCGVMHWAPAKGVCVQGGPHVAQGFNFNLPNNVPEVAFTQKGWRFCSQCAGLFYGPDGPGGRCAKGGPHQNKDAHPADFVLLHDRPEEPGFQGKWFFCRNCHLMTYGPVTGHCIAEKAAGSTIIGHDPTGSFPFVLPIKASGWID